ncbi:hypothetical protein GOODEAATRI_025139 [Goodea atripinnis]|uniref:Kinesin motor domain-containing protein n=1 Tax=Goodea atripinnis TaxID=208336 RepID=A0ABV0Q1M5_9TELE
MDVYNNEVYDLLARDEQGNAVGQRRDVVTTSSGASQVPNLTYDVRHSSMPTRLTLILSSPSQFPQRAPMHWPWVRNSYAVPCKSMTGLSGAALWEVSCINRSLSALSDVLGALAEQRPHVPYRNSKLTHLLQDTIGDTHVKLSVVCM